MESARRGIPEFHELRRRAENVGASVTLVGMERGIHSSGGFGGARSGGSGGRRGRRGRRGRGYAVRKESAKGKLSRCE